MGPGIISFSRLFRPSGSLRCRGREEVGLARGPPRFGVKGSTTNGGIPVSILIFSQPPNTLKTATVFSTPAKSAILAVPSSRAPTVPAPDPLVAQAPSHNDNYSPCIFCEQRSRKSVICVCACKYSLWNSKSSPSPGGLTPGPHVPSIRLLDRAEARTARSHRALTRRKECFDFPIGPAAAQGTNRLQRRIQKILELWNGRVISENPFSFWPGAFPRGVSVGRHFRFATALDLFPASRHHSTVRLFEKNPFPQGQT